MTTIGHKNVIERFNALVLGIIIVIITTGL